MRNIMVFAFCICATAARANDISLKISTSYLQCILKHISEYEAALSDDVVGFIPKDCPATKEPTIQHFENQTAIETHDAPDLNDTDFLLFFVEDLRCLKSLATDIAAINARAVMLILEPTCGLSPESES